MAVTPREQEILTPRTGGEPALAAGAPIRQSNLWIDAWRRYIRNRGAVVAAVVFALIVLYCLLWPFVSPYDPDAIEFASEIPRTSVGKFKKTTLRERYRDHYQTV